MLVTKRNGHVQSLDYSKIHSTIHRSIAGVSDVSANEIEHRAFIQLNNKMQTSDIMLILIKTAADMIQASKPNYQYVAAKLLISDLRKQVWGSYTPSKSLYGRIKERVEGKELYDSIILEKFTEDEVNAIEYNIVKYDRDDLLTYSGARQFLDKYLVKNRKSGVIYELPQEANILISMCMFMNYPKETRISYIKEMYDKLSTLVLSLPTPIYAGVRTPLRQFSSCCVIDCGDSTDSILSSNFVIGKAVTKRYGLGINVGRIRGIQAPVSNATVIHTGIVPFLKMFESSTKGFVQNGLRGGGGTVSYPFWHWEVETLIELKNNKGVVENRVRSLDYSIGLNKFFLQRALKNEEITLFSSEEVPLLTEDYRYTYDEFTTVYTNYEKKDGIRKKRVNALDLLKKIATERYETGRIYIFFMDNMNEYSAFNESIFCSNLCQEITLPTTPVNIMNNEGLVSVCILSCINVGRLETLDDLEHICDITVRFLDAMIDYQEYEFPQLRESAVKYRPLGIGISDLFHLLAKRDLKYNTKEAREFVHTLCEKFQYYLLKSSCKLAQEKGSCEYFNRSKYAKGILPIDNYKKSLDTLGDFTLECDWETLRSDIKKYGLRNCCLSAIPPTASSSSISNSTPGIDPPKSVVTTKMSKYGTFNQIAPDYEIYRDSYIFQNEVNNIDYFKLIGVIQKFIDQGISTNSYYMSTKDVSIGEVVKEITTAFSYGLKSLYYLNVNKGIDQDVQNVMSEQGIGSKSNSSEEEEYSGCSGDACAI